MWLITCSHQISLRQWKWFNLDQEKEKEDQIFLKKTEETQMFMETQKRSQRWATGLFLFVWKVKTRRWSVQHLFMFPSTGQDTSAVTVGTPVHTDERRSQSLGVYIAMETGRLQTATRRSTKFYWQNWDLKRNWTNVLTFKVHDIKDPVRLLTL